VHSNFQTFRFAIIITLVCSLLLAGAATLLKPLQQENVALDIKKNILKAAGITNPEQEKTKEEIQQLYKDNIFEIVLDAEGNEIAGKIHSDIEDGSGLIPMYQWKTGNAIHAYILPISGKGLWSTLYGYLALDLDGITVKGITFYKHGETPGLGAEIEKQWFTDNFIGKKIVDTSGNLVSVSVVRGKVVDKVSEDQYPHNVDGISGATITGRGINKFLKANLETYFPFLKSLMETKKGAENG